MSDISSAWQKGKRAGRKGLAPKDRRKIIDAYERDPGQSLRAIAGVARVSHTSTAKVLNEYKSGLLDKDGFRYSAPLVPIC